MAELVRVFQDAAFPQKAVLVVLLGSILLAVVSVASQVGRPRARPRLSWPVSNIAVATLALGLLTGAMTAFHMMDTTLRLPVSPSAKDLAPGVIEVSTLVGLGALAGLAWAASALPGFGTRTPPPE